MSDLCLFMFWNLYIFMLNGNRTDDMTRLKTYKLILLNLILLIIPVPSLGGAKENTKAVYFTDKEGLPRNMVSCFVQDKYGYGWVGTGNGISRFDGYNFIGYKSLKGQFINTMILDSNNNLWIGTDAGLFQYDRLNDSFTKIMDGYTKKLSEYKSNIYFLLVNRLVKIDSNDTTVYEIEGISNYEITNEGIWYSTSKGLYLLNSETIYLDNRTIALIRKIDDVLWIACRNGALYYLKEGTIKMTSIVNHYNILDIEKIDDQIWIATDGGGIIILDQKYEEKRRLAKDNENALISSNSIYDISLGLDNTVWISTYGAGLILLTGENKAYSNITPIPGNSNSLVDKEGVSICVDRNHYYFGTNYGFSVWDKRTNKYTNFDSEVLEKQINGRKVTAINKDQNNNLWVGTYDGLIGKYSSELKLLDTYHICSEEKTEMQQIVVIYTLDKDNLLIGTHYRDKSLLRYNTKTQKVEPVQLEIKPQNKFNFQVNNIRVNKFGEIVVLVRNLGIFLYDKATNSLENFLPDITNRISFRLNDFYQDRTGNYWFATQTDGLVKLSSDGRVFDKWTMQDGFPTNTLISLESINDTVLWISTIDGLCRFNIQNNQIQIFNYRHGLASNEFLPRTSTVTPDKKIIFGNSEGFLVIEPDKLIQDTSKSDVVISDFTFHNQSIKKLEKEKYLEKPLEETSELRLPYKKNSFTISFFTRDNHLPKYNNYAYMLKGLEDDWIYLGENNHTTYTNLSQGKYTFMVKSTNKDNIWNEYPTKIEIIILPPWYASWIAILTYIIFTFSVFILFFRIYHKRLQLKKDLEISEYKVKTEHELTEKKLAFFTNISHDLKTPLTLISAPLSDLIQSNNLQIEQYRKLEIINRNSRRLYKLISDLIDFRKITQNQLPLKTEIIDLNPVIENIYEAFQAESEKKDIDFTFDVEVKSMVCVDTRKIEKILWNLLSNAIKFTNIGGKIWLFVHETQEENSRFLNLVVRDTGEGFSESEKDRIFDRFYQIGKTKNLQIEGSGIGLSIVNDLVKLHHGSINVDSIPGRGTTFKITIPCDPCSYSEIEKQSKEVSSSEETDELSNEQEYTFQQEVDSEKNKYNLPRLLIVEDNLELLDYLGSHFKNGYKLKKAINGKEGLAVASETEPDIIITDVTMPVMNGQEFCRKLRDNFNTSHIPVIMLTANTEIEQKIEGLSSGADIYVTKPFEIKYLDALVQSLLQNRRRVREKFLGIEPVDDDHKIISGNDIQFFNELKNLILSNITNENLNIDLLSDHFSISRTQLNRKIKALSGLTPNNYIKNIRLRKAYELIKQKGMRVSEAAYQTGFTDPNYFTICFKKEFGENPSTINKN